MPKTYTVDKDYHNSRFDRWFKNNVKNLPQSLIQKIIRLNKVKINKRKIKSSYRVQKGDSVLVYNIEIYKDKTEKKISKFIPSNKEKKTYDDFVIENNENFIIINKPAGIPVQSGTKAYKNLTDLLKNTKYFDNSKPYIVHRLDKETSGILIIAKTREYAQLFTTLFRIRKIHKTYLAMAYGKISNSLKILKDDLITYENGKKIIQKAITNLKVIKSSDLYSFIELNPITGRKHQLRKQLYNIGHPIVGDDKYYLNRKINTKNKFLMLHAYKIKFMINDLKYNFKAPYNKNFKFFLNKSL